MIEDRSKYRSKGFVMMHVHRGKEDDRVCVMEMCKDQRAKLQIINNIYSCSNFHVMSMKATQKLLSFFQGIVSFVTGRIPFPLPR